MIRVGKRFGIWRLEGIIWLVVTAFFSPPIWAHSSDTLTARLVFEGGPDVCLEMTADVAGTPWLRDAPNPASAMGAALRVALPDGRSWLPSELGEPLVSVHQGFQHPTPMGITHEKDDSKSELLTAIWKWRPSVSRLRFEVPKDHPANILLWTVNNSSPDPSPKGHLLLASDKSPPIDLPFKPAPLRWNWQARLAALVAVCGIMLQAIVIFLRFRSRRMA